MKKRSSDTVLDVETLSIRFGGLTAVSEVSLQVKPGEIVSVIGPNGAGKTTLFNAITGVYMPTEGRVTICGRSPEVSLRSSTIIGWTLSAVLTGLFLTIAVQVQSLWDAIITANYIYQQPFPWTKALHDGWQYLLTQDPSWTLLPFFIGGFIGAASAASVWSRSRLTPDCVARCGVSRTFQNIRLFPELTALENVLLGMDRHLREGFWGGIFRTPRYRAAHARAEQRALELLAFVELKQQAAFHASQFSYGHRRRLEIARALASDPRVLLLDEPAAGINPAEAHELVELIRKIRDRGVTVVLIEHHMPLVMGISDRIIVLNYGKKIAEGTPDEVRQNPAVIEAYLGSAA